MWRGMVLLLACGCGAEPSAQLSAALHLSAGLHGDTDTVNVYALGPRRSDGIFLTCPSLLQFDIQPTDGAVDGLASTSISLAGNKRTAQLTGVEPGDGRIIYAAAIGGGSLVGNGCTDAVTVPEGGSVDVTVQMFSVTE